MSEPTILIIDDVKDIVDEMIEMLGLMDLPAIGANSIGGGIDTLLAYPAIRVVVCDVRLPRECGAEILQRVSGHSGLAGRDLRYAFMTGDPEKAREIANMYNQIVMTKPVDPRRLIACISDLLETRG